MHDEFIIKLLFLQCQEAEQLTLYQQRILICKVLASGRTNVMTPLAPGCFCTFKASLADVFFFFFGKLDAAEQIENTTLAYYHLLVVNSGLFTHVADSSISINLECFISVFGLHQHVREISGSIAAKCSTGMFCCTLQ